MIEPKTLNAINYFLDEDIECDEESLREVKDSSLISFYKGRIDAYRSVKELVNMNWKPDSET